MDAADAELARLAEAAGDALAAAGLVAVTAESCTGGWIAKCLTDVAGSSAWFDRAFITYSNAAKTAMVAVPEATLREHGAVSAATVRAMAAGALAASGADVAVAVSGIAGPGGGTPDKPVGTVWLGWARAGQRAEARLLTLDGDREAMRRQTVAAALAALAALAAVAASAAPAGAAQDDKGGKSPGKTTV